MISVTLHTAKLNRDFRKLEKGLEEDKGYALDTLARNIATKLGNLTPPTGTNARAKGRGEAAISEDVNKIYRGAYQMYAQLKKINRRASAGYIRALQNGDISNASLILLKYLNVKLSSDIDTSYHKDSRSKGKVPDTANTKQALMTDGDTDAYKARLKQSVGFAKAGWFEAARQVRGVKRKPPVWLRDKGLGGAIKTKKYIIIYNNAPYITDILRASEISKSIGISIRGTITQLERKLDGTTKKF